MKKQREIKFRYVFKDKNGKLSMEEWSIEEIEEMELEDNHTIKNPFLDIVARLRFTGLKDVNGKPIFEGDILEATEQKVICNWPHHKNEPKKKRRVRWSVYCGKAEYCLKSCQIDKYYPSENPELQNYLDYKDENNKRITRVSVSRSGFWDRNYFQYTNFKIIGNIFKKAKELKDDRGDDSGKYENGN